LDYNVPQLALEVDMSADRVEVSWDPGKSKWLVRIQSGEEVIRRYCDSPKNADEQALRAAAEKTVRDEGYEVGPAGITVHRESAATR
jgi:phosphomannomutase